MTEWTDPLRGDPLPWLLDGEMPAVRHLALVRLLDRPAEDPQVAAALASAMASPPIRPILDAQHAEGWWEKPGPGYAPKYTGTVWQLIFLGQMGADPADPRVSLACDYVLDHAVTQAGGFGASGVSGAAAPPASAVIHCLNGNLLRALIGFGRLDDPRARRAVDWECAAITGNGEIRWHRSGTSGPMFACAANEGPCAWGAVKAVLGLAAIPVDRRDDRVRAALAAGVEFLLGRDPSVADYPTPSSSTKPSSSWFRLGFPSGYVTDVLQVMEAVCDAGAGADPRLDRAVAWLLAQQDGRGRWVNRYAYVGKLVADIDQPGMPSRWVTLRACRVLKAVGEARTASAARA